jgi:hypothetical protein
MGAADNGMGERTLEKGARSQDRQESTLLLSGALFKGFCFWGGWLDEANIRGYAGFCELGTSERRKAPASSNQLPGRT